jgi:hypothetical protein
MKYFILIAVAILLNSTFSFAQTEHGRALPGREHGIQDESHGVPKIIPADSKSKAVKFFNNEDASGSPVSGHVEFHKRESTNKLFVPVSRADRLRDQVHRLVAPKSSNKTIQKAKKEYAENMKSDDPATKEPNYKRIQPLPNQNQAPYARDDRKSYIKNINEAHKNEKAMEEKDGLK